MQLKSKGKSMLKNGLDLSKLQAAPVDLEQLKHRLSSGKAVLITGAGFSLGCENIIGEKPPLANQLSRKLCEYHNLEPTDNLKYSSDICIRYGEKETVLEILKNCFSLVEPAKENVQICSIPWRRIYTTNYDNSVELAYTHNKKSLDSLSLIDLPQDFVNSGREMCVHLNGSIQNAVPDHLNERIRLSDASYLSADFFLESKWRSIFNKDLEHCTAIVFVGYSLYDFDIEKVLNDRPHLANKTYFIVHEEANHELTYKLSNYGHVSTIGVKGFGEIVSQIELDDDEFIMPTSFTQRTVTDEKSNLDDFSTQSLLLYGKFEEKDIDTIIKDSFQTPYMFKRCIMDEASEALINKKHVFIQSELGNGKSIFLKQLAAWLTLAGHNVWEMTDFEGNACQDLENLSKSGEHIIILDDINEQVEFFKYFTALLPTNITLLLSDRSVHQFSSIHELNKHDIEFKVLSLDRLTTNEIKSFMSILDDQNLWKQYTARPHHQKIKLINEVYNGQLANLLLDLLKSPDIKSRISELLKSLLSNPKYKKTILAISLCDIFAIRKEPSNIADIAGNEEIFTSSFRSTLAFASLFSIGQDSTIISKSSILGLFIVNNLFSESYVVENCLEIMGRINDRKEEHLNKLHSKMRTFSNVEKLMPQKQAALNNYFVGLKRKCIWLRHHPHYWVQYAMCRLSFGDTLQAQDHLNTAYKYAEQKNNFQNGSYHTDNIDTQQARLFLLRVCEDRVTPANAFELFQKAHELLTRIKQDNHCYRQVIKYEDVYTDMYHRLNKTRKDEFESACKVMLVNAKEAKQNSYATDRTNFIDRSIVLLEEILKSIKEDIKP